MKNENEHTNFKIWFDYRWNADIQGVFQGGGLVAAPDNFDKQNWQRHLKYILQLTSKVQKDMAEYRA